MRYFNKTLAVVMVLALGLTACSHDSQKAQSELGKQAKATEDKAVSQINQANQATADKMKEADK